MWWYRNPAAAAAFLLLTLTGCGFQPLYGSKSVGLVDEELKHIKIQVIADRTGQQAHNYLLDRLNRKGRPAEPRYLLEVTLTVTTSLLGIERDESATRAKLVLVADLQLSDIETREVLLTRSARSTNSYNIVDSAVATRSAEADATDRAARQVSEDIRLMLSLYFRRHAGEQAEK